MILTRAPLRLPLGGGGTDLPSYYSRYGGFFVSAAIDKYVYVNLNRPASDDLIRVRYSRSEEVERPQDLHHDLVRGALDVLAIDRNVEIGSMADVPAGTGMGSSGSYLIALLLALHTMKRDHQPRWSLAEQACHIEIDMAGHPVGKQDQYVAAFGGLNCFDVGCDGAVTVTPLKIAPEALEDLAANLLLYYTGTTRASGEILSQQKAATDQGDSTVVDSLHRTKELGLEIRATLEKGDLARFGELLHDHWENKKRRSTQISSSVVDRAYAAARDAGALGGKVIGAGGGGFLMLLSGEGRVREVRRAMETTGLRHMPFAFDVEGAKVLLDV